MKTIYKSFDRREPVRELLNDQKMRRRHKQAMLRTMRITLLTMLVLCVMFGAAVLIYSRDMTGAEVEQTVAQGGEALSLSFSEKACTLSPDTHMQLNLITVPTVLTSPVTWSSSDNSIVSVDGDGNVTAVGSGQAVITAESNGQAAVMVVNVSGDIAQAASSAIERLANEAPALEDVLEYQEMFEEGSEIREVIDQVVNGSVDEEKLDDAAEILDIDKEDIRTAAEVSRLVSGSDGDIASISFTGDVTLAQFNEQSEERHFPSVYERSGSYTYPFDNVKGIFTSDDLTVVNFEGTLTNSNIHKNKEFYFRGAPEYAGILTASGIECATLANNHANDYLAVGYKDTKKYLTGAGVSVFDEDEPITMKLQTDSGTLNVVLLAFYWANGAEAPPQYKLDNIYDKIRQYGGATNAQNLIVVNCHWGKEGIAKPLEWQQKAAHKMVDLGADIVIGHHPHVLQGIERYNGRFIAYSLGNFAFSGNSSASHPETVILRAKVGIDTTGVTVTGIDITPCYTTSTGTARNNYQPMICFGKQADSVMSLLNERSDMLSYGVRIAANES